jgi:hypothetical protein
MNELAKLNEPEQQIRDIERKLNYVLERATEMKNGERRIEQRFGISLDENYFNEKAGDLYRSLTLLRQQFQQ